jgi:predicted S18 family serine protease
LDKIKEDISKSNEELEKGNYELCLSQASKAKAEVDTVLSVFGVDGAQYKNIVDRKLDIVRDSIAKQSAKGIFPILGYSYYEYANSLKESDVYSALLYSEYALELGNLDIYFKEGNGGKKSLNVDARALGIFLAGILAGLLAASLIKRKGAEFKESKIKR